MTTEEKWLEYTCPDHRLIPIHCTASERKLRLFAVAACRRVSHFFPDPRCHRAVDAAERLADGLLDAQARAEVIAEALAVYLPIAAAALFQGMQRCRSMPGMWPHERRWRGCPRPATASPSLRRCLRNSITAPRR